jgi:Derlin-2/3
MNAQQCQLVTPLQLYYSYKAAFTNWQPWRMATTFFYFGSLSLDFVFHMFFLRVLFLSLTNHAL